MAKLIVVFTILRMRLKIKNQLCIHVLPSPKHRLWAPPSLLSEGHRGYFTGVKRREGDQSPPSRASVNNKHSYDSTAPVCLHGVGRATFASKFFSPVPPYNLVDTDILYTNMLCLSSVQYIGFILQSTFWRFERTHYLHHQAKVTRSPYPIQLNTKDARSMFERIVAKPVHHHDTVPTLKK
jgi:hypothetical protein